MGISKGLRTVSSKVIRKLGGNITYRKVSTGIYNPSTGTVSEVEIDTTIKGVLDNVSKLEVNDLVTQSDKKLTIAAKDITFTPSNKDRILIASIEYKIISINTTEQENNPISYDLFLR